MISPQTCPVCRKPLPDRSADQPGSAFPFCSVRCRQVDFFRWSEGRYAIVEELDPELAALLGSEETEQNPPDDV